MVSPWKKVKDHKSILKNTNETATKRDEFRNKVLTVEYCESLITRPSSKNYAALNKWLEICPDDWLLDFLDCGALTMMFQVVDDLGSKDAAHFFDAVITLQIVKGIKTVINNAVGMRYILEEGIGFVKDLISGKYVFYFPIFMVNLCLENTRPFDI